MTRTIPMVASRCSSAPIRPANVRWRSIPNRITPLGQLIANHVERGELGKAYEAAEALVKRRPDSAEAHFAMAYVYRYAGMLQQSTNECNTALALDPGNYVFRSCAWAFMEMGKTERATDFVRLDAGSEWAAYVTPSILLREGKIAEAREAVKRMPTTPLYHRDLLESCLQLRPAADLDRMAHEAETSLPSEPDPETWYYQGSLFRVLWQETSGSSSAAERGRAELLRVRKSAFRSAACETSHRYSV